MSAHFSPPSDQTLTLVMYKIYGYYEYRSPIPEWDDLLDSEISDFSLSGSDGEESDLPL